MFAIIALALDRGVGKTENYNGNELREFHFSAMTQHTPIRDGITPTIQSSLHSSIHTPSSIHPFIHPFSYVYYSPRINLIKKNTITIIIHNHK